MFLLLWQIALKIPVMLLARAKVKCAINLFPFFIVFQMHTSDATHMYESTLVKTILQSRDAFSLEGFFLPRRVLFV